mmetsp:Transcript_11765/g.35714  ORF Transcript_11765/g.35714 Transcript_11765/m.35714 type:complete len:322 (+) Transcript_11765:5215-6180(+)
MDAERRRENLALHRGVHAVGLGLGDAVAVRIHVLRRVDCLLGGADDRRRGEDVSRREQHAGLGNHDDLPGGRRDDTLVRGRRDRHRDRESGLERRILVAPTEARPGVEGADAHRSNLVLGILLVRVRHQVAAVHELDGQLGVDDGFVRDGQGELDLLARIVCLLVKRALRKDEALIASEQGFVDVLILKADRPESARRRVLLPHDGADARVHQGLLTVHRRVRVAVHQAAHRVRRGGHVVEHAEQRLGGAAVVLLHHGVIVLILRLRSLQCVVLVDLGAPPQQRVALIRHGRRDVPTREEGAVLLQHAHAVQRHVLSDEAW